MVDFVKCPRNGCDVFYHVPKTASRILRLQPRVFLYLFISVSILHCTELRLSTLNKEYDDDDDDDDLNLDICSSSSSSRRVKRGPSPRLAVQIKETTISSQHCRGVNHYNVPLPRASPPFGWYSLPTTDPLPSVRQHPSYGDCLEVKRECYQNSSVLDCVTQCSQSAAHLCEQIGFVTLGPLRCA